MRIPFTKTKNFEFVHVIKDFYFHGSRTTKIVEKLGAIDELLQKIMPPKTLMNRQKRKPFLSSVLQMP